MCQGAGILNTWRSQSIYVSAKHSQRRICWTRKGHASQQQYSWSSNNWLTLFPHQVDSRFENSLSFEIHIGIHSLTFPKYRLGKSSRQLRSITTVLWVRFTFLIGNFICQSDQRLSCSGVRSKRGDTVSALLVSNFVLWREFSVVIFRVHDQSLKDIINREFRKKR